MRAYARERQPESVAECSKQQRRYLIAPAQQTLSADNGAGRRTSKYSLWSSFVRRSSSARGHRSVSRDRGTGGETTRTEDEDIIDARVVPDKQVDADEAGEDDGHREDAVDEEEAVPGRDRRPRLRLEACTTSAGGMRGARRTAGALR